jgi:hypothetical protein
MALNELFLEGRVETRPQKAASNPGHVEFILRHESSKERGRVEFFVIETCEHFARLVPVKVGIMILLAGYIAQRQWVEPEAGDVRTGMRINAVRLREIKPTSRPDASPPDPFDDPLWGTAGMPF